ncbi:hypothetical protein ISN44_As12g032710 [Arabidopsis suecica]|uniref:Uncharacterized protein n=1 Tax=Arabidopsis suecica TaxID=45249 RepID=A0A8T1YPY8_ARASU|nr:hypothetical protein ISN44_As12g032710 [Arabidopsis suecica]
MDFKWRFPGMWRFPRDTENCCIYRVPNSIRSINPEAYTPQLLLIGPLHHSLKSQAVKSLGDITNTKSTGYLNMEEHKKIYLANFSQRFRGDHNIIDDFRRMIIKDEEKIRASYSESTDWIKSQEFVNMILHDCVFIVELMVKTSKRTLHKTGDPVVDEPCLHSTVKGDLILLENQLPYFIFVELFESIIPRIFANRTLRELIIHYFRCQGKIRNETKFKHFTDLLRYVRVETLEEIIPRKFKIIKQMYNVDKLHSGGIKFEAVKPEFPLYVRFEHGILKMPCLLVDDRAETKLRNIMALEQCHFPYDAYVCNYIMFLDYLIDTEKDVELLVEKGMIKNYIGQHSSVAEMVNKLGLGIEHFGSHYADIADQVNAHYSNRVNKSKVILKRVYFGNVWIGTATIAAMLLLLFTLIQAVCSIIQVTQ